MYNNYSRRALTSHAKADIKFKTRTKMMKKGFSFTQDMEDKTFIVLYCIVYTCTQVFTVILKGLPGRF